MYELYYAQMIHNHQIVVHNRVPAKKAKQTDESEVRKLI